MKKTFLALMCIASIAVMTACGGNANKGNEAPADEQKNENATAENASAINEAEIDGMTANIMEQLDDFSTEGYQISPELQSEMKQYYGIDGIGKLKGSKTRTAMAFTGEGEYEKVTDSFLFHFEKENGDVSHNEFLAYAKVIYNKCKTAADDGTITDGKESVDFNKTWEVIDKESDRMRVRFYYTNQGTRRKVTIKENNCYNGDNKTRCEVEVEMERV